MLVNVHFPTSAIGGMAFGQPIDVAIARIQASVAELDAAVEKVPDKSDSFGRRLAEAVRARTRLRQPSRVELPAGNSENAPKAEGESFGQKLRAAMKRRAVARSPHRHKPAGTRRHHT
jgi:hypothetical protein